MEEDWLVHAPPEVAQYFKWMRTFDDHWVEEHVKSQNLHSLAAVLQLIYKPDNRVPPPTELSMDRGGEVFAEWPSQFHFFISQGEDGVWFYHVHEKFKVLRSRPQDVAAAFFRHT